MMGTYVDTGRGMDTGMNLLNGEPLRKDKRGRVRFAYDGSRFEVRKTGSVKIYERFRRGWEGVDREQTRDNFGAPRLRYDEVRNPALLRTLANAIDLAKDVSV